MTPSGLVKLFGFERDSLRMEKGAKHIYKTNVDCVVVGKTVEWCTVKPSKLKYKNTFTTRLGQ